MLLIEDAVCGACLGAVVGSRLGRSIRKAGSLGASRMMECQIDYPNGRYVEHIITWRKQGAEVRTLRYTLR